jgi:DNA-binding transcriptional LysR family regulator
MELRHVRYFLAVAEELNFTRAAEKIGIGQPPLSQQIRTLEREVGAPLFRRTRLGAELTEAGISFLPEARAMLAQAGRALEAARRGGRGELGRLRVGFTSSAAFIPAVSQSLRTFRRDYDQVDVSLVEAGTTPLLEQLAANTLDAVFIRLGHKDPEGYRVQTLAREPMCIVLPAGHPSSRMRTLSLAALRNEAFVLFPRTAGFSLFDEIIGACWDAGFEPALGQEAPQFSSAVNLVAAGMGVSLVPASMSRMGVNGVKYIPVGGRAPAVRLALATRVDEKAVTVRNFMSIVGRT